MWSEHFNSKKCISVFTANLNIFRFCQLKPYSDPHWLVSATKSRKNVHLLQLWQSFYWALILNWNFWFPIVAFKDTHIHQPNEKKRAREQKINEWNDLSNRISEEDRRWNSEFNDICRQNCRQQLWMTHTKWFFFLVFRFHVVLHIKAK